MYLSNLFSLSHRIISKFFYLFNYKYDSLLEDDGEVVILKEDMVDGEPMLVSIEEDDEYERIGGMFLERLNEIYGEEDEESDED